MLQVSPHGPDYRADRGTCSCMVIPVPVCSSLFCAVAFSRKFSNRKCHLQNCLTPSPGEEVSKNDAALQFSRLPRRIAVQVLKFMLRLANTERLWSRKTTFYDELRLTDQCKDLNLERQSSFDKLGLTDESKHDNVTISRLIPQSD